MSEGIKSICQYCRSPILITQVEVMGNSLDLIKPLPDPRIEQIREIINVVNESYRYKIIKIRNLIKDEI